MAVTVNMQKVVEHLVNGTLAQSLCRVCLRPIDDAAECVFTKICKENQEYSVADILKSVCDIEISEMDEYQVCSNCFLLASAAYKFFLLTKQSDDILNFYADELLQNVDSVEVPQDVVSESLCIPLPLVNPVEELYQLNLDELSKKLHSKLCDPTKSPEKPLLIRREKEHEKSLKSNVLNTNHSKKQSKPLEEKEVEKPLKIKTEAKDEEDDDIIIVQDENGVHQFFKVLPDGSMVAIDDNTARKYEALFKNNITGDGQKKQRKVRESLSVQECWLCSEKFRFTAKFKRHFKAVHDLDLLVCRICKVYATNDTDFNDHLATHPNVYRCDICGMIFKKRHAIINHLQNHEEERKAKAKTAHMCEVCGLVMRNATALRAHCEDKHMKRYTCYYCGKMYKSVNSFDCHIQKHERVIGQSGDEKDKKPAKKDTEKRSNLMCAQCGRSFVDERALLWHTRLHTNERPFKCDECGRGFISVNRRNQHALTSHSAPQRRCPLCPALFHLRSMVNTHIRKVHLRAHKRRPRPAKPARVWWRTAPVPVRELSVALQGDILALQARGDAGMLSKPDNNQVN